MKKLYNILILSMFINKLTSMQISKIEDRQILILDLPNEVLIQIVESLAFIDWDNIFKPANTNLTSIKNLAKTCYRFNCLCKEVLKSLKKLKERRFNELFESLKRTSLRRYGDISKEWLTNKLIKILIKFQIYQEDFEQIVKLVLAGADVEAKNGNGWTALVRAAINGYKEISEILVKAGANINAKDEDGKTALMWLSMCEAKERVDMLIKLGADVNVKGKNDQTALIFSVIVGRSQIVKMLIDAGADVNAKDAYGQTALKLANISGQRDVVKMILNAGAIS